MSFLSLLKKCSWILLFFSLLGCQSLKTREQIRKSVQTQPTPEVKQAEKAESPAPISPTVSPVLPPAPPSPPPAAVIPTMPKIGIILGAGGAKTYAHIGFLQELVRAKVPVHAIGGIELGAPMAALFAHSLQANDVEWQMFKLKDEDMVQKNLLGKVAGNADVTELRDFIGTAFNRLRVEDFRVPFACPSYNLQKNQVYLMKGGGLEQMLFACMAYPPFFRPYQGSLAAVRDVTALATYLRGQGANYIVLVNVLQAPNASGSYAMDINSTDNVVWSEIAGLYNKSFVGIDSVVSLDTSNYGIMDFSKRREIMNKGADSAARQLKNLTRKLGF